MGLVVGRVLASETGPALLRDTGNPLSSLSRGLPTSALGTRVSPVLSWGIT